MATDLELPESVPDQRVRVCRRCFEPLPTGRPAPPEDGGQKSEIRSPKPEVGAKAPLTSRPRAAVEGMCDRCLFLLLLEAITDQLPAAEVPGWMVRPSHVLAGRTPRECIDARDFEPVFEAVWLCGPPEGPVS